jgi:agmatinase
MVRNENYIHFGGDEVIHPSFEDSHIVVLPFCYEQNSSYGTGSREGPIHILNASCQLERLDEETLIDWTNRMIHTHTPIYPSTTPEIAVTQMRDAAQKVLKAGKFLLCLGGDHAITIGPVMAAKAIWPNIGVLQIDAHADLRDQWNGSKYNHACVMRRLVDDINVPIVQVGIRSFSPEEAALIQKRNYKVFYAHTLDSFNDKWMEQVLEELPANVYITLDLDGLDPSVIPGTGTPEPGGLTYRQVVRLIAKVGQNKSVMAADITELIKIKGFYSSEYTAAKLATKIIVFCT